MKRVITYGTFDLLHYGHINLLKRAKEMGDYLIVALSTDEFNWNMKQKKCYFSYEERKRLLEAIRYVDLVIPEESWEQKKSDIKNKKAAKAAPAKSAFFNYITHFKRIFLLYTIIPFFRQFVKA